MPPALRVAVGSALHWAAYMGRTQCLETILANRPRVWRLLTTKDEHGRLPIHLAAQQGHIECIQLMLRAAYQCSILQNEYEYDDDDDDDDEEEGNEDDDDEEGEDEDEGEDEEEEAGGEKEDEEETGEQIDDDAGEDDDDEDGESWRKRRNQRRQRRRQQQLKELEALRKTLTSDSTEEEADRLSLSLSQQQQQQVRKSQKKKERNEVVLLRYKDKEGNTPLLHACINNKLAAVDYLLMHGSTIRECNKTGITCLLYAADKGNLEMVKFLVSKGASVEVYLPKYIPFTPPHSLHTTKERDKYQNTPLLLAAGSNYTESMAIIEYLLQQGASISEKNKFGRYIPFFHSLALSHSSY